MKRTKSVLLFAFFYSINVFAILPTAQISNLSGDYLDPSGQGRADYVMYEDEIDVRDVDVELEKQAGAIYLKVLDTEFSLDELPEQINDLKSLNLAGLDFESHGHDLDLKLDSFLGENYEGNGFSLKTLSASCSGTEDGIDLQDELLNSCLNSESRFQIGRLELKESGKTDVISGLLITLKQNDLYLTVVAEGKRIKGYGAVFYEGDKIRIRLDKVKYKFIPITGRVFGELKKLENDKISVNRPWIEIQL